MVIGKNRLEERKQYSKVAIKAERGITLVALVITIIILIILTTVTMDMVLGDNGFINKANETKEDSEEFLNTESAKNKY